MNGHEERGLGEVGNAHFDQPPSDGDSHGAAGVECIPEQHRSDSTFRG